MCKNDWSPLEIKSQTPDSLFKALDNKWRIAIEKEQEIREKVFAQYFPDLSNSELFDVLDQNKGLFFTRRRRLWLLEGRVDDVEKDTHQYMNHAIQAHKARMVNRQAEKELVISKPDEVFDEEGNPVEEPINTIDVDALDVEDVTQDIPFEGT